MSLELPKLDVALPRAYVKRVGYRERVWADDRQRSYCQTGVRRDMFLPFLAGIPQGAADLDFLLRYRLLGFDGQPKAGAVRSPLSRFVGWKSMTGVSASSMGSSLWIRRAGDDAGIYLPEGVFPLTWDNGPVRVSGGRHFLLFRRNAFPRERHTGHFCVGVPVCSSLVFVASCLFLAGTGPGLCSLQTEEEAEELLRRAEEVPGLYARRLSITDVKVEAVGALGCLPGMLCSDMFPADLIGRGAEVAEGLAGLIDLRLARARECTFHAANSRRAGTLYTLLCRAGFGATTIIRRLDASLEFVVRGMPAHDMVPDRFGRFSTRKRVLEHKPRTDAERKLRLAAQKDIIWVQATVSRVHTGVRMIMPRVRGNVVHRSGLVLAGDTRCGVAHEEENVIY